MTGIWGARLRTPLATRCVKSGLSMMTRMSGCGRDHRLHRRGDAAQDRRQAADHGRDPHDGDVVERKQALHALSRHRVTAHAAESEAIRAETRLQAAHELGAELVARFLAGHDPDLERSRLNQSHPPSRAGRPRPGTGRGDRQRRASLPAPREGWSRRRRQFRRGLPLRPPGSVRGPMVGMSTRRSWPRFAALISTPPSLRPRRPNQDRRNEPTRRSIRSVPSGPSIASTCLRAMTAP